MLGKFGCGLDHQRVVIQFLDRSKKCFFSPKIFRRPLEFKQCPIQWVQVALSQNCDAVYC
jgi:hypothetical protein